MGVASLVNWPLPAGKSPTQAAELLHQRIKALGAEETGTFLVDCETYQAQPPPSPTTTSAHRDPRFVHVFHDSEHPATVFALTEAGPVLVADQAFDPLMAKLKSLFVKKSGKTEAKGLRFEWNDFLLKVGIVSVGPSVKGILFEVEYLPCVVESDCRTLIHEVVEGILGAGESTPASSSGPGKSPDVFKAKDKIKLYHEQFTALKKQVSGAGTTAEPAK